MSDRNAWMPLYVGDYLADTMHLTGPEHGAYLLLLMHAWRSGPLPEDERKLAAIARTDLKVWREISDTILAFFTMTDDGLIQGRLERIRGEQGAKIEQRRAAGKASAEARKAQRTGQREINDRSTTVECGAEGESAKRRETDRNDHSDLGETNDASPAPKSLKTPNPGSTTVEVSLPRRATEPEPESEEEEKEHPSQPSVGRSPRGSRLPKDWHPDPKLRRFATDLGLNPDTIAAQFRDYWHAKAGKDAVKLDWSATWRSWCRREAERGGRFGARAPAQREQLHHTIADIMRDPLGCGAPPAPPFDFEGEADHG